MTNSGTPASGIDLTEDHLEALLRTLPDTTLKIVIVDACHAGGFGSAIQAVPNSALLAAATAEGTVPYHGWSGEDGSGHFTEVLVNGLRQSVYDLDELASEARRSFGDLLGSRLFLKEPPGTLGTFQGLDPIIFRSGDFNGDILGPAVPEPASLSFVGITWLLLLRRFGSRTN